MSNAKIELKIQCHLATAQHHQAVAVIQAKKRASGQSAAAIFEDPYSPEKIDLEIAHQLACSEARINDAINLIEEMDTE